MVEIPHVKGPLASLQLHWIRQRQVWMWWKEMCPSWRESMCTPGNLSTFLLWKNLQKNASMAWPGAGFETLTPGNIQILLLELLFHNPTPIPANETSSFSTWAIVQEITYRNMIFRLVAYVWLKDNWSVCIALVSCVCKNILYTKVQCWKVWPYCVKLSNTLF